MIELSKLKKAKIGIIGAGYIGLNVYNYLNSLNISELEVVILNENNYRQIIEKESFDYFINCAGNSGDFRENIFYTIESNINLQIYLLKYLKVRKSYLTLSSVRLYGFKLDKLNPFTENYFSEQNHLNIDYIYDGAKKMVESILRGYSKDVNYDVKIVRLSNVYGKFNKLDDATLIKKIIKSKIENNAISVKINKNSSKDYLYIDDAVKGILMALLFESRFEIFNIASGESFSLSQVSEIIDLPIRFIDENSIENHSCISIEKAITKLNFKPQMNFQDGLRNIIKKY